MIGASDYRPSMETGTPFFCFFAREGEGGSGGSSRTFELVNSACMINLFGFLPGIFC